MSQAPIVHEMVTFCLVAVGSNLPSQAGSARETVAYALGLLAADSGVTLVKRSRDFATPAFPAGSGPEFVNAAVALEVALSPEALLSALHRIEDQLGRTRDTRWNARAIDLDLLAYGDEVLPDTETYRHWQSLDPEVQQSHSPDRLILPHPRLQERGFVLAPLADVASDWRHPVLGQTVAQMLAALPAEMLEGIRPLPERSSVPVGAHEK